MASQAWYLLGGKKLKDSEDADFVKDVETHIQKRDGSRHTFKAFKVFTEGPLAYDSRERFDYVEYYARSMAALANRRVTTETCSTLLGYVAHMSKSKKSLEYRVVYQPVVERGPEQDEGDYIIVGIAMVSREDTLVDIMKSCVEVGDDDDEHEEDGYAIQIANLNINRYFEDGGGSEPMSRVVGFLVDHAKRDVPVVHLQAICGTQGEGGVGATLMSYILLKEQSHADEFILFLWSVNDKKTLHFYHEQYFEYVVPGMNLDKWDYLVPMYRHIQPSNKRKRVASFGSRRLCSR